MNARYYAIRKEFNIFFDKKESTFIQIFSLSSDNQKELLCHKFNSLSIYQDCLSLFDYHINYDKNCLILNHSIRQMTYYMQISPFYIECNEIETNPFCYYLQRIHCDWLIQKEQ